MFEAKYHWVAASAVDETEIKNLSQALKVDSLTAKLLLQRGVKTPAEAEIFLNPTLAQIDDPFKMHDMQRAVERIQQAIATGEQITIYGDYDVDGISSTAVVYEALMELGAKVDYYIPNRFKDGYGPNLERYQQLIQEKTELLITVDNGVAGASAVEFAQKAGVDVIITDHHALPAKLPAAYAIVHPRYPGSEYSCPNLAGVGVAFKLVSALLDEVPQEMLDLVVLGTIADLVDLTGENRALVKFGLLALQQTQRPGLLALAANAKLDLTQADPETISFGLAPRLNSLGRLASGQPGVELLTTFAEDKAAEIATKIEQLNQKRQQETEKITTAAMNQLTNNGGRHLVNVVAGADWNPGLVGIVASRLVEKTQRPTLVLGIDAKTGLAKGSGRSIAAFDLFAALDPQRQLFEAFGGHQQACGLTIKKEQLPQLQRALDQAADQQQIKTAGKDKLVIAASLPITEIDPKLIKQINLLQPFGPGNPAPTFSFTDFNVVQPRMIGKKKNHLQFKLQGEKHSITAIDFFAGEQGEAFIRQPTAFKFVGHLTLNRWKNQLNPQIMVADLACESPVVIDQRTLKLSRKLFQQSATYFFFEERHYKLLKTYLPLNGQLVIGKKQLLSQHFARLVIVDCPPSISEGEQIFSQLQVDQLELIFYPFNLQAGIKIPTRTELAQVYRYVVNHQQIQITNNVEKMAAYLQVKPQQLNFILQMFFEAGFVKIDNGLMTGCTSQRKIDLTKLDSYRSRLQQLKSEKILIQGKSAGLTNWILRLLTN